MSPVGGGRAECILSRVTLTNVLLNNGSNRIYVKPSCQNFSLKDKVISISARLYTVILISKRGIKKEKVNLWVETNIVVTKYYYHHQHREIYVFLISCPMLC